MQWPFHSGEQVVAHGPLVLISPRKHMIRIVSVPSGMYAQRRFRPACAFDSLIRIFTGCVLDCQGCKLRSCGQRRLRSDCTDAHTSSALGAYVRRFVFSLRDSYVSSYNNNNNNNVFIYRESPIGFSPIFPGVLFYTTHTNLQYTQNTRKCTML